MSGLDSQAMLHQAYATTAQPPRTLLVLVLTARQSPVPSHLSGRDCTRRHTPARSLVGGGILLLSTFANSQQVACPLIPAFHLHPKV